MDYMHWSRRRLEQTNMTSPQLPSYSWIDERLVSPVTILNLTQTYDSLISRLHENNCTSSSIHNDDTEEAKRLYNWRYNVLRNLHLTCILLVQIYKQITSTTTTTTRPRSEQDTDTDGGHCTEAAATATSIMVLQQTARRCQILIEVLRLSRASSSSTVWEGDDDDDSNHEIMENVQVEAHAQYDIKSVNYQSLFSWNFSSLTTMIDLSGVELEEEEQCLIQMANTPIPTEKQQQEQQGHHNNDSSSTPSSSSSSAAAAAAAAAAAVLLIEQEKERLYINMKREWGIDDAA